MVLPPLPGGLLGPWQSTGPESPVRPSDLSRVESAQWVKVGVSEDTGRQVPAGQGVLAQP